MKSAEELLLDQVATEIHEVIDLGVILSVSPGEIDGVKFSLIQEEETFEYVNGHGNETGEFGKRVVTKVLCEGKVYTYSEFNLFLKNKRKGIDV
jgi:hypothetical protein